MKKYLLSLSLAVAALFCGAERAAADDASAIEVPVFSSSVDMELLVAENRHHCPPPQHHHRRPHCCHPPRRHRCCPPPRRCARGVLRISW